MGAQQHEHIRHAFLHHANQRSRAILPYFLERHAIRALEFNPVKSATQCVKASGIDDNVEFILGFARLDAGWRNALDRCCLAVHQRHIRLVVAFEIEGFQRHAPGAEAVIRRNQHLRHFRVLHALTDFIRDKTRHFLIRRAIGQQILEIADPNPEALFGIELFQKRLAFRG